MANVNKILPDWLIGLALTALFFFVTFTGKFDFTDAVEMKCYDLRARVFAPAQRNQDIELVVVTEEDLSELGRFPWPRDIVAQAVQHLSLAGAKVIALNLFFPEPEQSAGLQTLKELKQGFEALNLGQEGPGQTFHKKLTQAVDALDNDTKLYKAMKEAGNVVLPVRFDAQVAGRDVKIPDFIARHSFKRVQWVEEDRADGPLSHFFRVGPLLPSFAEAAAGVGHMNLFPDRDGVTRHLTHAVGYMKDTYFPSFPLAIVKTFRGLKDEDQTVLLGRGIHLRLSPSSGLMIPVADPQMRTLINWNKGPGVAFHQTPFSKVYRNQFQTSLFRDKIVIIGPTDPGIGDRFVTPVSGELPGVDVIANAVENILNNRFFARPPWVIVLEFGCLILFGLFVTLALPKLKGAPGAAMTLLLLLCLSSAWVILYLSHNLWLKISPPMLVLVSGYVLLGSKRFLMRKINRARVAADSVETNRMLGLSFQHQGMLDLAFDKFRQLPPPQEATKDLLYNLGLDFERKKEFSKALAAYNLVIEDRSFYKDLEERIPRLKAAEATEILGAGGRGSTGDMGAPPAQMGAKQTLGRYEVVGELGRGAMGTVYRGEDPTGHRAVALKTIRLSEFDEEIKDQIKERFIREAESAALLTHPNIATVYGGGEENDLAYMAMEFLSGTVLEEHTRTGHLLPIPDALALAVQAAEALDYAHGRGMVHGNIRPANIVLLKETGKIKVTDFGAARIISPSKPGPEILPGALYYMSPEQITGKTIDGRSDIFSLGVVLFELLTGQKPFRGDDATSLLYQIAKEPHDSPRHFNPKIPRVIEKILDKALEKDRQRRYQRAGQMAVHLKKVIARIDELRERRGADLGRKVPGPGGPSGRKVDVVLH